jgi:hypothetical protein
MAQTINNWFTEKIKDNITVLFQPDGGLLDNTMMRGDTQANIIKFPRVTGRSTVYQLTGAIENVPTGNPGLDTVQVTPADFEAAEWWRVQDAYKAGPVEQDALAKLIIRAVRRKRDGFKLDALAAFFTASAGAVTTIGTGAEVPDPTFFEQGRAEMGSFGTTDADDVTWALVPEMWFSQLKFYKEYSNSQWSGPDNVFSQAQRLKMRTVQGVTFIVAPDEYFTSPGGTDLVSWMWQTSSMGAESPYDPDRTTMSQHEEKQGSPYLIKAAISGAAIGIQPKGVKKIFLKKLTSLIRPAT